MSICFVPGSVPSVKDATVYKDKHSCPNVAHSPMRGIDKKQSL